MLQAGIASTDFHDEHRPSGMQSCNCMTLVALQIAVDTFCTHSRVTLAVFARCLQVEEQAMYGILSTKILYTFFRRDGDVASKKLHISRTLNGSKEPVGPAALWLAAKAAQQPALPRTEHAQTPLDSKWIKPKQQAEEAAAPKEAVLVGKSPGNPEEGDDGNDSTGRPGAGSNADAQQSETPARNTRSRKRSGQGPNAASAGPSQKRPCLAEVDYRGLDLGHSLYQGPDFVVRIHAWHGAMAS